MFLLPKEIGNTVVCALRRKDIATTLEKSAKDLGGGRTLGKGRKNAVLNKRIKQLAVVSIRSKPSEG